ncbi:MAG TPA: VOC family protein [Thermoanaerobaculia bacterium]|nr:VOC family protein [Thermoanaerobaculia bacterium]
MSTQTPNERANGASSDATLETKLEVVVVPVADVERSKAFYLGLGWRLDADFPGANGFRAVQVTPPGSPCSVHFGRGVTSATPGSVQNLYLVVDDIQAARAELLRRGAGVSDVFHFKGIGEKPAPGPDPAGRSYNSFATFKDPDGNSFLLQEIKQPLPGRGFSADVAGLTELLRETEKHHGEYEPTAPKHHWSQWYAAYIIARERGRTAEEAAGDARRHVEEARG